MRDLTYFSDGLLRLALAIDLANPTLRDDADAGSAKHGWKAAALRERPDLVRDAYFAVAQSGLSRKAEFIDGLYDLLHNDALAGFRGPVVAEVLRDFPSAPPFKLEDLLVSPLDGSISRAELAGLARAALARSDVENTQRDLWLVAAYLVAPEEFQLKFDARFHEHPGLLWTVRDLAGYERHRGAKPLTLHLSQMERILLSASPSFPDAHHPGSSTGNTNPWDAADFITALISQISAEPTDDATLALQRLVNDA
jgi:hypothetical protein